MPATINLTESDLFIIVRSFLMDVLGTDQILRTQGNRVPKVTTDCVYMTPIVMPYLSTSRTDYTDTGSDQTRSDSRTINWTIQLDCYGSQAMEWANTIATIMRTEYAADLLAGTGVTPLYADDPRQASFISAEEQWNDRWMVDIHVQPDIIITTPQQFADQLIIERVEVGGSYPPGE